MNTVKVTIGKNLVLLGLVVVTLLSFFNRILNWHDLLLIQALIGLIFVFFCPITNIITLLTKPGYRWSVLPTFRAVFL